MTKARTIADLGTGFVNISDTGTEGTKVASGTSAQRGSTAGQFRFNSTTGLAEYYDGTAFKAIDSPPTVSSLDVTEVDSQAGGNQTIVITGSGFSSGATVTFIGNSGTDFNASTVTVNSNTQITAVAPKASFLNAQEPYGVKVTNVSGLANTLADQINVDTSPSWQTASGSLGSILEDATGNHFTVSATDADGDTVSYSLQSGSLGGLSLNSSTGVISGDPTDVSADTTNNFTIRATAGGKTSDRDFSYITTNVNIFEIMVLGGGGSGGYTTQGWVGGGGGSGGISYRSAITLANSTNFTVTVGNGGATATNPSMGGSNVAQSGQNSQFTGTGLTLVAYGGGGGAGYNGAYTIGASGGSGGGSEGGQHGQSTGASATQGTGGTTHYGERGGIGNNGVSTGTQADQYRGGGGGGTGEAGDTDGIGQGGDGTSDFNTWLAATSQGVESGGTRYIGGGGSAGRAYGSQTSGGLGGGGQGGDNSGSSGTAGQANTGSGGGGRGMYNQGSGTGGAGGSGLVIVRYAGTQIGGSSGGTIVTTGGYTYHTFTSSGTFRTST